MPNISDSPPVLVGNSSQISLTILQGAHMAPAPINVFGNSLLAILIPKTFTACNITFFPSLDQGATYSQLTENSESPGFYTLSSAAIAALISSINSVAQYIQIPLDPIAFVGVQSLNISLATAQSNDLTVRFIMGPVLG